MAVGASVDKIRIRPILFRMVCVRLTTTHIAETTPRQAMIRQAGVTEAGRDILAARRTAEAADAERRLIGEIPCYRKKIPFIGKNTFVYRTPCWHGRGDVARLQSSARHAGCCAVSCKACCRRMTRYAPSRVAVA